MTPLALACGEGRLAVVALAAELALVKIIHLHAGAAFFVLKDRRVAVTAFEHRGMNLVAEDRGRHIARGIGKVLLEPAHVMALCAVFYVKGDPSVMASAAGSAFIHLVHDDVRGAFLHLEEFRMALAAAVFLRMVLVREVDRKPGGGISECRKVMAVITGVFVKRHLLMRHHHVALVTVHTHTQVLRVRELPL